jgi:hypothetical protein
MPTASCIGNFLILLGLELLGYELLGYEDHVRRL